MSGVREPAARGGRLTVLAEILAALAGALLIMVVATVPLRPDQQALFALITAAAFLIANRFPQRAVTMFLVMLSLAVSLRYLVWRATQTLGFTSWLEVLLGSILVLAECYAIVVLVLGYVQTVWPLHRQPIPLPEDTALWPSVDVFIPTLNEPLEVVRATVLGAMGMDWPRDRLRIYLLDDGRRAEFRDFAAQCGIGYISRHNGKHAKAGNLNNALELTGGDFIAVFDCDHIPTRAFLQLTMGWLVHQPSLALVQTPHHFYSPDPFQRNLAAGTRVPSEGNMFYGLVQDGNDYWNAAFFCGSCGVIRRTALDQIGGFAVETVTEDAHTMLKLHRRGWQSAYLRLPLAAGLATERLAQHIGQRVRWARGMLQIFRIDNPLLGPGLSLGQRICYLQASGHFLFALPRVVFLCAPLAYLLLDQNIIAASPLAIVAYALPHLFHAIGTNSRIQRNWRHSFWSEVYETVLALALVRVTLATLALPSRGRFNVTAKGGLLENGFFDLRAVYPNLFLGVLLVCGIVRGIASMALLANQRLVFQALLLNTVWAVFGLLTVLAALAVGREARQLRNRPRVEARLPVVVYLADGRVITGESRDLSLSGGSFAVGKPPGVPADGDIWLEFSLSAEPLLLRATLLRWEGSALQVIFAPETIAEEAAIVRAVFGRADAWIGWADDRVDQPLVSLGQVLASIAGVFRPPARLGTLRRAPHAATPPAASPARTASARRIAASILLAAALLLPAAGRAQQGSVTTVRPLPQPVDPINPAEPPAPPDALSNPPLPSGLAAPPPATTGAPPLDAAGGSTRVLKLTLRQLGALGPLALRGTSDLQGVQFGIRGDEVVTAAQLNLVGAMSPRLIPQFSDDTVTLNEQYVGTIPVDPQHPEFNLTMPINPVFFQDDNRLNIRFTGRYTTDCNDPLSYLLWSTIYDSSNITLTLERLPPQRDLARLPLPFFDPHEKLPLVLPFVLPAAASDGTLKAAAIVASWFGQQADFRGAQFPVLSTLPATGDAVVIEAGSEAPAGMRAAPPAGPTLSVLANPNDPQASLLVVAGRTTDEAIAAARALALAYRTLGGVSAVVQDPSVAARLPYDAPAWIPTGRKVRLGELADASALQNYGYTGTIHVPFRTAPDFFTWRGAGFPLTLRYRTPTGPIIDVAPSRLDVSINGLYLSSLSLAAQRPSWLARTLGLASAPAPIRTSVPAYDVFGANDLQFFFDARPLHRGDCVANPQDLRQAIDPDSSIDLSRGHRFTRLPNLAFFVGAGFPFTRMADLSQTAVILPARPNAIELSAFLTLMGEFGAITHYPVANVAVATPAEADTVAARDLILLGTIPHLSDAAPLLSNAPMRFAGDRLSFDLAPARDSLLHVFSESGRQQHAAAAAHLATGMTPGMAVLLASESPLQAGRSLVGILAAQPQGLDGIVATLRDPARSPAIQGDLAVLSGGQVTSFRVGATYTVGHLPLWIWPGYLLGAQPILTVIVLLAGCMLVGLALFWTMRRRARRRVRDIYRPG
jgi:cellulose synthase (UDP-forming)